MPVATIVVQGDSKSEHHKNINQARRHQIYQLACTVGCSFSEL